MQLVTAGGRLESPNPTTPPQVFAVMSSCWHSVPEQRPTFAIIIERLGYCLQDPDVLNVPLPIFQRAPSMEKDLTLMRPPPDATDYLVPNPCSNSTSNYSVSTEKTELLSPDTCSTVSCNNEESNAKLLELLEDPPAIPPRIGNWRETTFSNHNSVSAKNYGLSSAKEKRAIDKNSSQQSASENKPLLLDAGALLQQPSRYVNVDVNDAATTGDSSVSQTQQQPTVNC